MKVLITGVAGLLGSRLADWLVENIPDCHIVGIDNLSGGYIENVNANVEFYQIDLKDGNLSSIFERTKPDYVYHFAAYAAEGLSPFIRMYNYENNTVATANVINECIRHDVKRLVFTSTMAVYGHGDGNVFNENQIPKPIDPYGVAKYACEMDIQIAGEQHNLDWCIIRPHNVYGIKQNIWDKYRNVLGIWMYQHMNNQPMSIFGDGEQKRAFSYIDDILEPLWNAAIEPRASREIINLGGVEEWSINEASKVLLDVITEGEVIYEQARHEVRTAIPTYEKSVDILKFQHKTTLYGGLAKMWEWAKKQPKRDRFVWPNYELDKGIYSFWKNTSKSPVKELVIAAYDKDLSWTQHLNNDVVKTVYKKGTQSDDKNEIFITPNVGRCVHSFFNHIYTRYDSLADYTFFAQDYPFDHWGNLIEILNGPIENYEKRASLIIGGYYGYHNNTLGTAWKLQDTVQFDSGGTIWCLSNGYPQDSNPDIDVDRYWELLFNEPKPPVYEFIPGGHFIISKEQVHVRPKEFYKKIVDLLEQEEIAPWLVERLECYIFNNNYKIKDIN